LVYVSSSSVFYRPGHQLDLTEDSPIGPRFVNEYAATKYRGERLVTEYPGDWIVVRPRAVFGPGDTVLFPRILAAARRGRLPLFVGDGPPPRGDLVYIDTLLDYLFVAATRRELSGFYNVTNNAPVVIQDFLLDIFARLGLRAPSRRVSVRAAFRIAAVTEVVHSLLHLPGEPPITQYGVGVFAWSKTFDVRKSVRDMGPPSVALADGVESFLEWQRPRL
jgi:nucleoside-diphosphate-sugar epimerase